MSISIWLRHPASSPTDPPILVTHEDTLTRCLSEGWSQVETPTAPAEAPAAPESTTDTPAPAEAASAPPQRARRTTSTKVKEG